MIEILRRLDRIEETLAVLVQGQGKAVPKAVKGA